MTRTALLASLAAFVLVQGVSVIGQGNKTPMTPWGEPDLQGTWTAEAEERGVDIARIGNVRDRVNPW